MTEFVNSVGVTAAGKDVTVFEMNLQQIRQWLSDVESKAEDDFIGDMLFDDVAVSDLTRMSTITKETLSEMVPSAIRTFADICKEKNEFFFGIVSKRRKLLDKALGL